MTLRCSESLRAHEWVWQLVQEAVPVEQAPVMVALDRLVWQERQRIPLCGPESGKQLRWLSSLAGQKRQVAWQLWQSRESPEALWLIEVKLVRS